MDKKYWENRWEQGETGWDLGSVSPPIKSFVDQLEDKSTKVLIPGCGNAYEAEYMTEQGFENVHIVDISATAIESFLKRYPSFNREHIHHADFFELEEKFDLIIEQTFFCALPPEKRPHYAIKMHDLLVEQGCLVGLLFNFPLNEGPPYGGSKEEYKTHFAPYFSIRTMETAYNSIKPRLGNELFIHLIKR